jgi:spore coat polysaccharide biosynthesis protein SpsF
MLLRQIERVQASGSIDKLVVATSVESSDDPIEQLCLEEGVSCYRGKLDDVLDRFYQASRHWRADHVVRLTGDCPLTDPQVIDAVIQHYLSGKFDYVTNCLEPTFPDGLDVEVFGAASLERAWREAMLTSEREHVATFISSRPETFRLSNFRNGQDLSALRWTVDHDKDFELVTRIYEALYEQNQRFTMLEILAYLDLHPDLKTFNTEFVRNEGLQRSIEKDGPFRDNFYRS